MVAVLQTRGGARLACWGLLIAVVIAAATLFAPASASAVPCLGGSTSWLGGDGSFNEDANWSNGGPSALCDVSITAAGAYTVSMTGGASMKSFTLGGAGSSPKLVISAASPNTNLNATATGIDVKAGAAIVLTCPPLPGGCNGGPTSGGSSLNSGSSPFANQGTITVDAASGTGATITGPLANTGTVQIEQDTRLNNGAVVNQGALSIADGKTLTSSGSSCGDTAVSFKNDAGGSINATGTGALSVVNYEQGNGTTSGSVPVNIPCGSVKYTGSGASKVQATGGFTLTGEIQPNQSLTVLSQSNNTNAVLGTDLTNKGSITLSCFPPVPPAMSGCNGGDAGSGVGINANGHKFTNAGTLTVAALSGTGVNIDGNGGTITNTGTMQFDQSARLGGLAVNKGTLNIADGKVVKASSSSCGSGEPVKNETGGSINATGTGTLEVSTTYEQGDGTTSGAIPVSLSCGNLKYTGAAGAGVSKVRAFAGFDLSGEMQAGQELTVTNNSANTNLRLVSPFTSKGSITFTCPSSPCNGPGFNGNGNLFVNAGTFTVDAAASNGTTLDMSSGGLTNAAGGILQLDANTNFNGGGPLSNQGTLRIVAGANTPSFTNAGTIVLDQSATNPFLNTGTLTNTGTIATSGASANTSSVNGTIDQTGSSALVSIPAGTKLSVNSPLLLKAGKLGGGGTLQGSVNNSGGAVAPGASPGTLTVSGDYTQGAGGSLEVEVTGTGVGQFDKLTVGGGATLDGTLALQPSTGYASSAALGDGIDFLTYGSARAGQFAQVTTTPSLACPKQFALDYADGEKRVGVDVLDGPISCGGGGNAGVGGGSASNAPPLTSAPPPKVAPKPIKCKKGFRKVKVKGKSKCKKIKKKHGKR